MITIIYGPRLSGKTTKLRELMQQAENPMLIETTGMSVAKEKFRDMLKERQVIRAESYYGLGYEFFMDDAECLDPKRKQSRLSLIELYKMARAPKSKMNLTLTFTPAIIDMTAWELPFWWVVWQNTPEEFQTKLGHLKDSWPSRKEMRQNFGKEMITRSQFDAEAGLLLRDGVYEMKFVEEAGGYELRD